MPKIHALLLKAAAILLALTAVAAAQQYPTRPVRIVVPFPPGGFNDIVARILAAQLSERMGKQFIVDNDERGTNLIFRRFKNTGRVAKSSVSDRVVEISARPEAEFKDIQPLVSGAKGRVALESGDLRRPYRSVNPQVS